MSFTLTQDDLSSLSENQKVAIMEALMTGILADGKAKPEEIAAFDHQVEAIPWGIERARLKTLLEDVRHRVLTLKTTEQVVEFVKSLAERLPSPEIREKAFRGMLAEMVADDNLTVEEKNIIVLFANAFGLTVERLETIRNDLGKG